MRACGVQLGIGAAPVRAGGCGGEMRAADTPAKAWGLYLSGLLAAMVAAVWMRPPGVGHSFGRAVAVAAVWMAATVLAGAAGLSVGESFLEGRPAYPRMNFVVGAAATWVLLPPMLLCWVRGSGWATAISAVAGAVMAACVWGRTPRVDLAEEWEPWSEDPRFAGLPAPDSGRLRAFAIAVCVELAVVLASRGEVFVAMTLSGVAAFLFVWKRMASLDAKARERLARRAVGASAAVLMAILIVIPLLLARFVRMNGGMETTAQAAARTRADTEKGEAADAYPDGYQGIVLFTVKLWDTETAAETVKPLLRPGTGVISFQNGVHKEAVLSRILGADAVIGGTAQIGVAIARPARRRSTMPASLPASTPN